MPPRIRRHLLYQNRAGDDSNDGFPNAISLYISIILHRPKAANGLFATIFVVLPFRCRLCGFLLSINMNGAVSSWCGANPNWQSSEDYLQLSSMERRAFAWEWLRRNPRYAATWSSLFDRASVSAPTPREFGLVAFVDPTEPAWAARPIWAASADDSVIVAEVADECAMPQEGLDLLAIASLVTLEISPDYDQHLLLSDGRASVRVDIVRGTLLGGPALLRYRMQGAARLRVKILALRRLISVMIQGAIASHLVRREKMASRWIIELRVADALRAGATQREIAETLFRGITVSAGWRGDGDTARLRVQRLIRTSRLRMRDGGHFDFLEAAKP